MTVIATPMKFSVTVILAIFKNRIFSFIIYYRNNLIDKKDSYLILRPPSWDDRNYSYGHQLYPSAYAAGPESRGHLRTAWLYIDVKLLLLDITVRTPLIRIWPLYVCISLKMISTTSRNIQCLSCKHNYLNIHKTTKIGTPRIKVISQSFIIYFFIEVC
jgi:hypothetical protein